jgi:hypothetical protein
MRFLLIALTLTASAAQAQATLRLQAPNITGDTLRLKADSCDLSRTVNWSIAGATYFCEDLRFWLTKSTSCPDVPAAGDTERPEVSLTVLRNGTREAPMTFQTRDLPGFRGTDGIPCPTADREDAYLLCASVKQSIGGTCTNNDSSYLKGSLKIVYDSRPPPAPEIESVAALDRALSIRVKAGDDTSQVRVRVERPDGTGARSLLQSVDQPLFRVENLENNVTYTITATALDAAENESAASEAREGTPILTRGFFDRYVEAGGQEMGGCGAAGGALTGGWLLAVLGFWLSSRRNRS